MSDFGGGGLLPSKTGGGQRKLRGGQGQKARAVVWQWVPTFKEAVPPPPGGLAVWLCPPPPFPLLFEVRALYKRLVTT